MQDIKVGDEVLSENAKTGKTEYQPVTALTHPHLDHLLEIRIEGEAEPLRPSTGHPFWVRSAESDAARWVKAGDLRAGDFLETPTGGWRRVVAVKELPGEQTVYNFTVANDHDYFVGQTGFLVHNAGCDCEPDFEPGDFSIWDWSGYPEGIPQPSGPFRLLEGDEYNAARDAANRANRGLHLSDPVTYRGKEIHEIHPVKFGGSPTDIENKIPLSQSQHSRCTTWWRGIQRGIE